MTGLERALNVFRDRHAAQWQTADDIGGCWMASHALALILRDHDIPASFRRWVNLPGLRTERQHNIELPEYGLIVDPTLIQVLPDRPEWPAVLPIADFEALGYVADADICVTCGSDAGNKCEGLQDDPSYYAARRLQEILADLLRT